MHDRGTDRLLADIAAVQPATGPDRLTAGYVRADPFHISPADRERIEAAKARHLAHALRLIGRAAPEHDGGVVERFDEATGPMVGGGE